MGGWNKEDGGHCRGMGGSVDALDACPLPPRGGSQLERPIGVEDAARTGKVQSQG